ncbi:FGGY-family carbohydrate kinase [Nitratireductor aquibiodomus]|uniref:FGGY-family carbohydrate kinase n=1 Tax=Nitratireductor aquibiodomus TaxID=204799 RepID=UPI001FCB1DCE|nr:FGGY-family carbohydrate kinase [Nitratireductor aquibiodomus]
MAFRGTARLHVRHLHQRHAHPLVSGTVRPRAGFRGGADDCQSPKRRRAHRSGANGIVVLPYFSGERTPIHDPHARGVIFGLDLTHTRADIYRGFLEGIAYGVTSVIETYEGAGASIKRIAAVGGGTKNAVWSQAISDASGKTQDVAANTVGAAFGNAFLAAVAVGAAGREDIRRWNPMERRIAPQEENRAVYDARYRTFKELYARNSDLMKGSSTADVR